MKNKKQDKEGYLFLIFFLTPDEDKYEFFTFENSKCSKYFWKLRSYFDKSNTNMDQERAPK